MFKHINKLNIFFISCTIIVLFLSGCRDDNSTVVFTEETVLTEYEEDTETETYDVSETEETVTGTEKVVVYVCGAVVSPGVYELESTDIKEKALEMAGGFTEGAAINYVNLAEPVEAGEKIYFPYESELEAGVFLEDVNILEEEFDKININTATKDELMTLSGIGESKAEDIITYREEHGGFKNIEEIMNINGIKEGVYNKIKDSIVVN